MIVSICDSFVAQLRTGYSRIFTHFINIRGNINDDQTQSHHR